MTDMLAARQHVGKFTIAVVAVLSLQQEQLFFSSIAYMSTARQPAEDLICGCSSRCNA